METKADIRGRRARCRSGNGQSGLFVGGILVLVGVGLLLQNFGILRVRDLFAYWPVLPIVWGVRVLASARSMFSYLVGGLAIGLGGMKLLDTLDIIEVGAKFYAPVILISVGVILLVRNFTGSRFPGLPGDSGATVMGADLGNNVLVDQPHINPMAVFAGIKRRVVSQQLETGEVMAMFGGVELDFRPARMKGPTTTIEVNAIFGGIKMRIPETWTLEVRGSAVFGGFEDKTIPAAPMLNGEPAPKLVLTGNAMFGGVEVEN